MSCNYCRCYSYPVKQLMFGISQMKRQYLFYKNPLLIAVWFSFSSGDGDSISLRSFCFYLRFYFVLFSSHFLLNCIYLFPMLLLYAMYWQVGYLSFLLKTTEIYTPLKGFLRRLKSSRRLLFSHLHFIIHYLLLFLALRSLFFTYSCEQYI